MLGPGRARAREHPRRPNERVVVRAADQGRVAVGGQCHAVAERATRGPGRELWALLSPGRARAREHPRRPSLEAVVVAADQSRVAVGRQRHAHAEPAPPLLVRWGDGLIAGGELRALLGPGRARAREHPRRPNRAVVVRAADQGRVAVGGQRHAVAELAGPGLTAPGELWGLLDQRVDAQRVASTPVPHAHQQPTAVQRERRSQPPTARVGRRQAAVAQRHRTGPSQKPHLRAHLPPMHRARKSERQAQRPVRTRRLAGERESLLDSQWARRIPLPQHATVIHNAIRTRAHRHNIRPTQPPTATKPDKRQGQRHPTSAQINPAARAQSRRHPATTQPIPKRGAPGGKPGLTRAERRRDHRLRPHRQRLQATQRQSAAHARRRPISNSSPLHNITPLHNATRRQHQRQRHPRQNQTHQPPCPPTKARIPAPAKAQTKPNRPMRHHRSQPPPPPEQTPAYSTESGVGSVSVRARPSKRQPTPLRVE